MRARPDPDRVWPLQDKETRTMLHVILLGNLGGDAELRYAANERPMASSRIAGNQVRTSAAGEREESTEWFRIDVAGHRAEFASRLQKRQRVAGRGCDHLQLRWSGRLPPAVLTSNVQVKQQMLGHGHELMTNLLPPPSERIVGPPLTRWASGGIERPARRKDEVLPGCKPS